MLTRPCRGPTSCTAVSLLERMHGSARDAGLADDLRSRRSRRLAEGGDPPLRSPAHGGQALASPRHDSGTSCGHNPALGHAHPAQLSPSPRASGLAHGFCCPGSSCSRQQWLFVDPCMCGPLIVMPLGHGELPHFKMPPAQGWALKRCLGFYLYATWAWCFP